jgi:hypothetical protein
MREQENSKIRQTGRLPYFGIFYMAALVNTLRVLFRKVQKQSKIREENLLMFFNKRLTTLLVRGISGRGKHSRNAPVRPGKKLAGPVA